MAADIRTLWVPMHSEREGSLHGLSLAVWQLGLVPPGGGARARGPRYDDNPWGLRASNLPPAPNQWGTRRVKGVSRRVRAMTISSTSAASSSLPGPSGHPSSVENRPAVVPENVRGIDKIALGCRRTGVGARTSSNMGTDDACGWRARTSKISIRMNWGCKQ
jgi:hypothetical protein